MVTRLRSTGMSIRDVRQYADLVRAGDGNEAERLELLRTHRDRVREQLRQVAAHLDAIEFKIDLYETRVGTEGSTRDERRTADGATARDRSTGSGVAVSPAGGSPVRIS